MNWLIDMLWYR